MCSCIKYFYLLPCYLSDSLSYFIFFFFFFSSRRRHTRFDCDWSSDVCSSDLVQHFQAYLAGPGPVVAVPLPDAAAGRRALGHVGPVGSLPVHLQVPALARSEERRVGKECRSRWSPYH